MESQCEFSLSQIYMYVYLCRQQERGLMQKARRLMDKNSVSFQMFLILLSYITLASESQISVFKQCQSNTYLEVWGFFLYGGNMRKSQNLEIVVFSVKKN